MSESLDFLFYTPPSIDNWNPHFGKLGGTCSNDNNSPDFNKKKKIQNSCLKSTSKCELPESLWPHPKIPYRSNDFVETVTQGYFSTHFKSDLGS